MAKEEKKNEKFPQQKSRTKKSAVVFSVAAGDSHHESNHPAAEIYVPASVTKNMLRRFVVPLIGRQREEEKKALPVGRKTFSSHSMLREPHPHSLPA